MNVTPDDEFILVLDKLCQCRNLVASAVNWGRGIRSRKFLVATAVVKVVVGGDVGDDVHAKVSGSRLKLGHVVRVDGGGLLGVVVDEEVGVVVVNVLLVTYVP